MAKTRGKPGQDEQTAAKQAVEREGQTGVLLSPDDCNVLMHGLMSRDELEGHLIPEALAQYEKLVNRIIDVGVGWSGGAEDA